MEELVIFGEVLDAIAAHFQVEDKTLYDLALPL